MLVAYATTEGHTRKVAAFIAERLRIRGCQVDLVDTDWQDVETFVDEFLGACSKQPEGGAPH